MEQSQKTKVVVLCGGFSEEREISLASGENVMRYLDQDKYEISRIDVISADEWHWYGTGDAKRVLWINKEEDQQFLQTFHIYFNVLHGRYGEDGQVQDFFDTLSVSYTGSNGVASALTIDKVQAMKRVMQSKILVPEFFCITEESTHVVAEKIAKSFGYPAIVKPNDSGSTLGLSLVQKGEDLDGALEKARKISQEIIMQRYIFGREFTCGVLGNSIDPDLILLPPVEIIIKNQIFDYNDKYFSKETQELCPASVDKFTIERIKEQALLAHRTLGCDGLSRSDFRMDGTGQLYFLETNTSPGLTAGSLCPKEALVAGISLPHFLDRIIDLGLSRVKPSV